MKTHCILFQETVFYFAVLHSHCLYLPLLANKPSYKSDLRKWIPFVSRESNSPAAWYVHSPPPKSQDPRMVCC